MMSKYKDFIVNFPHIRLIVVLMISDTNWWQKLLCFKMFNGTNRVITDAQFIRNLISLSVFAKKGNKYSGGDGVGLWLKLILRKLIVFSYWEIK